MMTRSTSTTLTLMLTLALAAGVVRTARAQEQDQDPAAQANPAGQAPAGQQPPADQQQQQPTKPKGSGAVSFGFGIANGVQEQRSWQLDGNVQRPFSDGGRFVATAGRQYQNVTFPSPALLADRTNVSVGADENF